jgi:hypothetical protein
MKAAIIHVKREIGGRQMFDIILENSKFRAHKQMTTDQLTYGYKFCWFIPLIVGYFPRISPCRIFINPTSRDGIKSRFPPIFRTRFDNATRFFDFHWPITLILVCIFQIFRSAITFWVIWSVHISVKICSHWLGFFIYFQKLKNRVALSNRVRTFKVPESHLNFRRHPAIPQNRYRPLYIM